ncbi:MAG TPA: serine/threonine-protein kinase [Gemmatimonadales bacterium]|nr:serine/threonine-protein kinase [Gemmatimonadales bacterium]
MDPFLDRLRAALRDRYAVDRLLGAGGMGVVVLAHDLRLDRPVAIKVLRPELGTESAIQRFVREAKLLAALTHPSIVPVYDAGVADGLPYYAMEYVAGRTLAERLTEGPLRPDEVRALGTALLDALTVAHRQGIIHRDIKPANIFLTGDRILLGDFGAARVDTGGGTLTDPGALVGTPAYMAPEQLVGSGVTPRTDLYAVAMVLYEASTGVRWQPAAAPEPREWSLVPHQLAKALARGLAVSPDHRWPNAETFRAALRPRRRGTAVAIGLAAALVILLAVVQGRGDRRTALTPLRGGEVAVLPFDDGASAGTGRRLARLVSNRLEWYPAWRLAPLGQTFAWWDATDADRRDGLLPSAIRARVYAQGDLDQAAARLRVTLRDSTGQLLQAFSVPGGQDDLLGWSAAIADSVVARLFPEHLDQYRELTAGESANVAAWNELLAGQEAFRRDDWSAAQAHFERALALDSAFAQAAWQLTLVRRWRERSFTAELQALNHRFGSTLPPLQAMLVRAQLEPDLLARFAQLAEALRRYPRRGEAALLYADELVHRGPLAGIPLDSGLAAMRTVAQRERFSTVLEHMVVGYARLGDRARADSALSRLIAEGSAGTEAAQRRRLIGFVRDQRFAPRWAALKMIYLRWTADSLTRETLARYVRLGNLFDIPAGQVEFGRLLADKGATAAIRGSGHEALGLALILMGRPSAALAQFDSAADCFSSPDTELARWEWRALGRSLGLPSSGATDAIAIRRLTTLAAGHHDSRAAWALAMEAHARGDTVSALRWADRLSGANTSPGSAALAILAAALQDAARRRPDSALARSAPLLQLGPTGLGDPFARAILYLNRGEWLLATGDSAAAARAWGWSDAWDIEGWPQGAVQAGEVDAAVSAIARLRRSALAVSPADREHQCRLATRVRELWSDAEPAFDSLRAVAASYEKVCG